MMTGETEAIVRQYYKDDYDAFLDAKDKRRARRAARKAKRLERRAIRRSDPKRIVRRANRKRFLKDVGQVYNAIGGATAIGTAIDAITQPQSSEVRPSNVTDFETDYTIGIGQSEPVETSNSKLPTVVYVLAGVALIGAVGVLVMQRQKHTLDQVH